MRVEGLVVPFRVQLPGCKVEFLFHVFSSRIRIGLQRLTSSSGLRPTGGRFKSALNDMPGQTKDRARNAVFAGNTTVSVVFNGSCEIGRVGHPLRG
jgi:hypothetical protein